MMAQRLKELRKKSNITQVKLAEMLNVTQGAITNWESGRAFPDFTNQLKLAEIYGITIDELLGREPPSQAVAVGSSAASVNGDATVNISREGMTAQEWDLLRIFRAVSGKEQYEIMGFVYKYDHESEDE